MATYRARSGSRERTAVKWWPGLRQVYQSTADAKRNHRLFTRIRFQGDLSKNSVEDCQLLSRTEVLTILASKLHICFGHQPKYQNKIYLSMYIVLIDVLALPPCKIIPLFLHTLQVWNNHRAR